MKVVLLSDTHGLHAEVEVPEGDLLIYAGDFMSSGHSLVEAASFAEWFRRKPHPHKVIIAGNHDILLEKVPAYADVLFGGLHYLHDSCATVGNNLIWGSPYQPEFFDWAFNLPRGEPLKRHWDLMPKRVDILVTHGPPHGILDTPYNGDQHVGCEELRKAVDRAKPRLHVFGHIHGPGGSIVAHDGTIFVNASVVNERYEVVRPAIQITL